MAWIEQTKKASIKSGGPQYYLQDLADNNKDLLRAKDRCPVRLWTPYGVIESGLTAVSSGIGKVGHDRVQSGRKRPNIAAQIAHWYGLRVTDIERIEFEDSFDHDSFVIRPRRIKFRGKRNMQTVYPDAGPLTVTSGHKSELVVRHIRHVSRTRKEDLRWAAAQIAEISHQHSQRKRHVDERDLLRTSGALSKLGISLGMYRTQGIDCHDATFRFLDLPTYPCPIEIEERSSGMLAKHHASHRKQRVVVLCMGHDDAMVRQRYVDVLELRELSRVLEATA